MRSSGTRSMEESESKILIDLRIRWFIELFDADLKVAAAWKSIAALITSFNPL